MILGNIPATCLTYLDCMYHKTDVWGIDNARYNRPSAASGFELHNKIRPKCDNMYIHQVI